MLLQLDPIDNFILTYLWIVLIINPTINFPWGFDPGRGAASVAPAFLYYISIRTYIYIDGFNFYYGAVKDTPYKWLDFKKLFEYLLDSSHQIISIKYFTG